MYSKETLDIINSSTIINNTNHWVANGLDWNKKPGLLIGYNSTWHPFSIKDAKELVKIILERIKIIENETNL